VRTLQLLLCIVLAAGSAHAQDQEVQARALFERAVLEADAGRHAEAAALYRESYALYAHPGTLFNLALSETEAGHRARAHRAWSELLARYGDVISELAHRTAEQRLRALEPELARIEIVSEPEGARVAVDSELLGSAPVSIAIEPGQHRVEAALEGYVSQSWEVAVVAQARLEHRFTLAPDRPAEPANVVLVRAPILDPPRPVPAESFENGPWPWILGGAGVLAIAGVIVAIALATSSSSSWRVTFP
jgi:hypothetical protein